MEERNLKKKDSLSIFYAKHFFFFLQGRKSKWYSGNALSNLTSLGLFDEMWDEDLKPILIPRISGTEGNTIVKQVSYNFSVEIETVAL